MPSIKQIDLSNGIRIVGSASLPTFDLRFEDFPTAADPEELSAKLTDMAQKYYEIRKKLNTFPNNDPVRQHPPILPDNCRIGAGNLVITQAYVAIHVFSLTPYPPKLTSMTSDFPIGGDWWL